MFERVKSGGQVIGEAVLAFFKYPQLLVPLLFSWTIYTGIILYFHSRFDWKPLGLSATLTMCFGIILAFSLLLCFSASWLLEMIEQIETGKPLHVGSALTNTIDANLFRMLPIALAWATVWFALAIVDTLTSKRKSKSSENRDLSFESTTKLLVGTDTEFSWSGLTLDMVKKLVRMLVFLSLPAVCWRGMSGIAALGQGLKTARRHKVEFFTGYMLSGAAAALVFLPVALPAYLDAKKVIHVPAEAWPPMLAYLAFAWSFSIYIEQMFTAELYLWHMNWERAVKQAQANGAVEPKLSEVRRPSLLDDRADLNESSRARAGRRTQETPRTHTPVNFNCRSCGHRFNFNSQSDLALFDYDLNSANGIQVRCPSCEQVTGVNLNKKRA